MKKYLRILFVSTLLISFMSCGNRELKKKGGDGNNENLTVVEEPTDTIKETPKDTVSSEKVAVVIEESKDVKDEKNVTTSKTVFYVIVGSFEHKNNADQLHKVLVDKGATSEMLEGNNSFTRVSKKAFETKEEAMKELERVRKIDKQTDAWILTKVQ